MRDRTVEPMNGQLKADGAGQMLGRGLAKVQSDSTAASRVKNMRYFAVVNPATSH